MCDHQPIWIKLVCTLLHKATEIEVLVHDCSNYIVNTGVTAILNQAIKITMRIIDGMYYIT